MPTARCVRPRDQLMRPVDPERGGAGAGEYDGESLVGLGLGLGIVVVVGGEAG
jgi:hypothetical protein